MNINVNGYECYREFFIEAFRQMNIIPVIGSGLSVECESLNGVVPSGSDFKDYMLSKISESDLDPLEVKALNNKSFSEIASIYEDDDITSANQRRKYLRNNFFDARYSKGDIRKKFFEVKWKYIYSLNLDDTVEKSTKFDNIILPNKSLNEDAIISGRTIIKLHGDVAYYLTYKDGTKIFTEKEYIRSLNKNHDLLKKLRTDMESVNILYIGCSLDSEIDLLSLNDLNMHNGSENLDFKKNIFFMLNEPSKSKRIQLKNYGITDVACFKSIPEMYDFIEDTWNESQKRTKEDIHELQYLSSVDLSVNDERNRDYFYQGLNLVDEAHKTITFPYYLIDRDQVAGVKENIKSNCIQILCGHRYCGKSYFLISLYKAFSSMPCFYFTNNIRISDEAFDELLSKKSSIILFDVGILSSYQLKTILDSADMIHAHNTSMVILIDQNDSDSFMIIKNHIDCGIDNLLVNDLPLRNRLTNQEADELNSRLPQLNIEPYQKGREESKNETFIDHMIRSSDHINTYNKFSSMRIDASTTKKLALLIALATKESLYYSEIVDLNLTDECFEMRCDYEPLIEIINTRNFERSSDDMSNIKVVLNSKFWLNQQLLSIARGKHGYDKIVEAYKYILMNKIDFNPDNLRFKRKGYKDYTFFETINSIFGGKNGGKRDLVAYIYKSLIEILGNDYQFNHQRAKCLMYNAEYSRYNAKNEYIEAKQAAIISKSQVENEMTQSSNDKLSISLAHINYTIASIDSALCQINEYSDVIEVEKTIHECWEAIINPHNEHDLERDKKAIKPYSIINFINGLSNETGILNNDALVEYNDLINKTIFDR